MVKLARSSENHCQKVVKPDIFRIHNRLQTYRWTLGAASLKIKVSAVCILQMFKFTCSGTSQ